MRAAPGTSDISRNGALDEAPVVLWRQGAQRIGKLLDAALDGMAPIGVLYLVEIVVEPDGTAIRERGEGGSACSKPEP